MKKSIRWALLPVVFFLTVGGCGNPDKTKQPGDAPKSSETTRPYNSNQTTTAPAGSQDPTPIPPGRTMDSGNAAAAAPNEQTREDFLAQVEKNLEGIEDEIETLEEKIEDSAENVKTQYENVWKPQLEKKRDQAKERLAKAKDAAANEWAQFKSNLQTAMQDLSNAYDRTVEDLKLGA